jgi:hypothetical protein
MSVPRLLWDQYYRAPHLRDTACQCSSTLRSWHGGSRLTLRLVPPDDRGSEAWHPLQLELGR